MSFRFIHTADLHLDAPLRAMAFRDGELAREIGTASRTAFTRIIDLCISEGVAFLLIAGDLWDGEYSSTKTPRFLKQELLRLHRSGISCFIIRGNHDALARRTGELDAPDDTTVFGARASTAEIEVNGHHIAIHGLSFRESQASESLLPRYPAPKSGAFNIGMMHTSLSGSPGHDNYAPCPPAALMAHGYNYWALGHIHRRAEHNGAATIVMPGIPQGRDIGEAGCCSVTLVSVADDNSLTLEQRVVAPLRFERAMVDCNGISDWADLLTALQRAIEGAARDRLPDEQLVIRPVLHGNTWQAWRIARDYDKLTEEVRAFAGDAGIWIDKLEIQTDHGDGHSPVSDLPDDLIRILHDDLPDDPGLIAAITLAAQELANALPAEMRGLLGQSEAEQAEICRDLLAQGTPAILSALAAELAD
ncbi:MAG: DNA repair exonuclease [Paracoccus sp. (in: a-proteobacteria)]|nr:DNA repair exonuclease [Paracoccus sp. (in: a-proteobacteria)]